MVPIPLEMLNFNQISVSSLFYAIGLYHGLPLKAMLLRNYNFGE
jgi:hypothetical protein